MKFREIQTMQSEMYQRGETVKREREREESFSHIIYSSWITTKLAKEVVKKSVYNRI